ncbi:hypothetical protein QUF72_13015 [Desulfobacterales bacterium HSG2]|nr:hypothetical protein [Desulfobacterales bacterium HSG2]
MLGEAFQEAVGGGEGEGDSGGDNHRANLTDILMKVAVRSDGQAIVPEKNLGRGDPWTTYRIGFER